MRASELTHGEARDVADYLNSAPDINEWEMLSALINAMNRIAALEKRLEKAERLASANPRHPTAKIPTVMDPEDGLVCAACGRGHNGLPCPHVKGV